MKRLLIFFLALYAMQTQAQILKKRNLDEQITKELTRQEEGILSHFQITYGYWQQNANFEGFNEIFKLNPVEYPTFQNQLVGLEMSVVGWRPNKKWKGEVVFGGGVIPYATYASNSTTNWEIDGKILNIGLNTRRELWTKPNFWLDTYIGIGLGVVGVGLTEHLGKQNTTPSLQGILSVRNITERNDGVSQGFLNGTIGLAGTALLRFKTKEGTLYQFERGIPLTFKLGYNVNLAAGDWSNEYSLSPQPKSSLSGLTFSVGVGFYGKYSKK